MTNEKAEENLIQRAIRFAALKDEINKVKPNSVKYKGIERIWSPVGREIGTRAGEIAGAFAGNGIAEELGPKIKGHSESKINSYLAEGKSPEATAKADSIVASNKDLMSKKPTSESLSKLVDNSIEESHIHVDNLNDLERIIEENPKLSKAKIAKIRKEAEARWKNDMKPLNAIEATRPKNDVWAHSLNTAKLHNMLLKEAIKEKKLPEMSDDELTEKFEAAQLHDYGKSMVRANDLITKTNFREDPKSGLKKAEVDTHAERGAKALKDIGEETASRYSSEHHNPETSGLEEELLKAADKFNAITMKRVYNNGPKPVNEALNIIKGDVVKGELSQEAYDILEKVIKEKNVGASKTMDSPLEGIYATERGNIAKEKGIRLFDVKTQQPDFIKNLNSFTSVINGILAGRGLKAASDHFMDKLGKQEKLKALTMVYKDDLDMQHKLKFGYFSDKDIDALFRKNIDKIIEMNKA